MGVLLPTCRPVGLCHCTTVWTNAWRSTYRSGCFSNRHITAVSQEWTAGSKSIGTNLLAKRQGTMVDHTSVSGVLWVLQVVGSFVANAMSVGLEIETPKGRCSGRATA